MFLVPFTATLTNINHSQLEYRCLPNIGGEGGAREKRITSTPEERPKPKKKLKRVEARKKALQQERQNSNGC